MTDCTWLSDRIPEVALGRSEWTVEELQHLNGCRTCQRELELIESAAHLGDSAAGSLDASAMASSVLRRLTGDRQELHRRRRTWSFAGLAAAAAIAAIVWSGAIESGTSGAPLAGPVVAGRLAIPLPELESLQAAELDSVLQMMEPAGSGLPADEPGLGDLNTEELESVLDSWEG